MSFRLDLSFAHNYEVIYPVDKPSGPVTAKVVYYPGAEESGTWDGLMLKVGPNNGDPWIGVFAFGAIHRGAPSGIFALPDPNRICVVASGKGYIVRADDPTDWAVVANNPIADARIVPDRELVVFADHSALAAYGHAGLAWQHEVVSDHLKITSVTSAEIRGTGTMYGEDVGFVLDLRSGSVVQMPLQESTQR